MWYSIITFVLAEYKTAASLWNRMQQLFHGLLIFPNDSKIDFFLNF